MPSVAEQQQVLTSGIPTGTKVRTIEDPADLSKGIWLSTVQFYDNRGRVVQSVADNYRGGTDIITNRYDFTGKVLSTYLVHNNPAVDPANATATLRIRTSMKYDHAGRVLESWKTINDDDSKKALIAQSDYNELGQLKNKKLGKQKTNSGTYTATEIGNFDYSYTIRGWLKGINKEYANDLSPMQGAASRWFGMELNYDWGFANNQFNGNIGGIKWRSRGDGDRRAYGFGYDKVNRLLSGDFSQHNNTNYADNSAINFDMMMGDGTSAASAYDENGNIKAMKQWGVKLNNSVVIDDLTYNYTSTTNKLLNVVDAQNDNQTKLGDFRTSSLHPTQAKTSGTVDYTYDLNGNLKKDLNKDIGNGTTDGIEYNHLNLPWKITVKSASGNKGTITYVYDATGNKITKTIIEGTLKTVTYYAGSMIYQARSHTSSTGNDTLQFMGHEEGRTRYIAAVGNTPARFEHDYFVKDHLGNTRLVLTEEYQQDIYPAVTLEGSMNTPTDAMYIEKGYYNIDQNFIVSKAAATGIGDYYNHNGNPPVNNNPNSNTGVYSTKLYQQNAQTNKIGLGMTLKVMAGDQLNIWGKSYWFTAAGNFASKNSIPVATLLDAFVATPAIAAKAIAAGTINTTQVFDGITDFFKHNNDADATKPWAYINWVFFDERFNYAGGGFDRIGASGSIKNHNNSTIPNIIVPKNGYVFVYCSNESDYNVFFDNLQVVHTRGALLEETHYYPFGGRLSGICSNAAGKLENKYKHIGKELQSKEFSDGSGLEQYDFGSRFYDPQIGRWHTQDPRADKWPEYTPYTYTLNNPINLVDLDGEDVYILYYTTGNGHGDEMFKSSAETRKKNIEEGKNFDAEKDKVIMIGLQDMSDVQDMTKWAVDTYSEKYGKTAEVGVWSHSGVDGPIGTQAAKKDGLYEGSTQMSLGGWGKIDFNWKDKGTTMGFYGCNSANEKASKNFAQNISGLDNYKDAEVRGQSTSSYPSFYTNIRATSIARNYNWPGAWGVGGGTYMIGGNPNQGAAATSRVPFTGSFPAANPMNVYRNRQKLRSDYQPGQQKN